MTKPRRIFGSLLACFGLLLALTGAARQWTDITGTRHIDAEFVDLQRKLVVLKRPNGKTIGLPLSKFSQADQDFIKGLMSGTLAAEADVRPLLDRYCAECHGPKKSKAKINFSKVSVASLTIWRKAIEQIEIGEMPPDDAKALAATDRDTLLQWMKQALSGDDPAARDPGPALQRRLSRAEYERSIYDLIGIEFDAGKAVGLADESKGHGFANQADVLTLSPALMEKYFSATDQILDLLLTPPEPEHADSASPLLRAGAAPPTGRSPSADAAAFKLAVQYRWAGNNLQENQLRPHFQIVNRGHSAIPLRELTIRYWFTADGGVDGFQHWCDYAKGDANNVVRVVNALSAPVPEADAFLQIGFTSGSVSARDSTGQIQIRVAKPDWRPFDQTDDYSFTADLKTFADAPRVTLYRGAELVWGTEPGAAKAQPAPKPVVHAKSVEPSQTLAALRTAILQPELDGASARDGARAIIGTFARKAWRRPLPDGEVDHLLTIYDKGDDKGAGFSDALRPMLKAVLVSPYFLLRIEADRASDAASYRRVSDHELAVRLSYFLWSSPPDKALLRMADQGGLSDPAELRRQTRRMLSHKNARALTENFAIPWLQLSNLTAARPTQEFYPGFTPSLKDAMFQETLLFLEYLREQNRSVLELIDADYTFVNDELAGHYGLRVKATPYMSRVSLQPDDHRGGLLGMGSVLASTSHTYRTSPTMRGKYVLEVILGTPPPPPPANASALKEEEAGKPTKNFRESMERHASVPACAACHSRIDPLGFGLENYDAVGRWREPMADLDTTGVLPSGEQFSGPDELKQLLLKRQDQFLRNICEQMLTYALGRPLEDCDQSELRRIQTQLQQDAGFRTLVLGVTTSFSFQHRRNTGSKLQ
jgi:hypothetical protein